MSNSQRKIGAMALAVSIVIAAPAIAHHSAGMFDSHKPVSITGTVRVFQWTNPHCWIQVLARKPDGEVVEWSVEMGSPAQLYALGWRPGSLKAGEPVTIVIHPMRDGTPGGRFVSGNGADGKPLGSGKLATARVAQP
jgi:hypothetical protein